MPAVSVLKKAWSIYVYQRTSHFIGVIIQLLHHLKHLVLCLLADGTLAIQNTGHRGDGNPYPFCNIL